MLKKNFKLLAIFLVILTIVSSFSICFADDDTSETESNATTEETTTTSDNTTSETSSDTSDEDIYEGDLYVFDTTVNMDQLVDGNVYIIGSDVTISGQVNGNLFVMANSIKFENCYVRYTIYACGNDIYYNGACNDFYVAAQKLEMTYDAYVVRDVKAMANSTVLKSAIGRDVDLKTKSVDFGSDSEVPIIYGNLRYSADSEKTLADGIVEGDITYSSSSALSSGTSTGEKILNIALTFILAIVTSLVICALLKKFKPEYVEKLNYSPLEILKALGIGLLTVVAGIIVSILLLLTSIGAKLALILIVLLVLMFLVSMPIVSIFITNLLKPILKLEKISLYYVVLALVSIVIYGLTLIPFYIGFVISCIITILGYGLIVLNFMPKKELSEEELAKIAEKKAEKKALKAEKKENKKANKETDK